MLWSPEMLTIGEETEMTYMKLSLDYITQRNRGQIENLLHYWKL